MELEHKFNVITVSRNLPPFLRVDFSKLLKNLPISPFRKGGVIGMFWTVFPSSPFKKGTFNEGIITLMTWNIN